MGHPAPPGRRSAEGPDRATVAAGFVTGLLSGPRAAGVDVAALLRASGVPASVLADPRARVPIERYAALYNAVVREMEDEGFGLFPQPLRPGTFEFLCRGMLGSRTLAEALARAARFLALVVPDLRVTLRRERRHALLEIAEARRLRALDGDARRVFAFEWLLRLLHGLACWMAARSLPLDEVRFPFPAPAHAPDYALVYAERCSFAAPTLVARFDAALLDLPVRRDEADVAAFLEGAPGKISLLYRRDRDVARATREIVARHLPRAASLDMVARELGLAPRTLHRRLRTEGTSFRALRDAERREVAMARLERGTQTIAAIAAELGYAEPSAFFRAFHGWTGMAPSAWRRARSRA